MRCPKAILVLSALGLATPLAPGQSVGMLMKAGDPIVGMGGLDRIDTLQINDARIWTAVVDTTFGDNNRDGCLLRSGFLSLREGMALPQPTGAILDEWTSIHASPRGDLAQALKIRIGTGAQMDALYWNVTKIAVKGEPTPFAELPAGTTWDRFEVVRLTPQNVMYALAEVNNPVISGPREDALVRYRFDNQGNMLEATLLGTKGTFLDALGTSIDTLGTTTVPEHSIAVNNLGDLLIPVNGIGRRVIMKNMEEILAQELTPSPSPGRTWNNNAFTISKLALNDRGEYAFTGNLAEVGDNDQTNFLVVKNGEKFAQSGDVIPTLSTAVLAKATPMIALSNAGDLFWRAAALSGGVQVDDAFMRNYIPLVQKNRTVVQGNLVTTIDGNDNAFAISPEGRYFAGRVVLQTVGSAIVYVDFGLVRERHGCRGINAGALRHLSGEARLGMQLQIGMDEGPAPGALPILLFSRQGGINANGCGFVTAYGEMMLAPPLGATVLLAPWDGVNPSTMTIDLPNNVALVDAVFYVQGLFRSTTQPATYRLTNALQIEVGPP